MRPREHARGLIVVEEFEPHERAEHGTAKRLGQPRRLSPFRCATGCFDAMPARRGPNDACGCRADQRSAWREGSGGPLATEADVLPLLITYEAIDA
jgi:hypothetical protein